MVLAGLFACAFHAVRSGLVEVDGGQVVLLEYDGRRQPLILSGEHAQIRGLDGCTVEVEGPRTPAGMVVNNWTVKDAGDGSSGFVGTLRAYGARILIDDRNTGTTLALDELSALHLRAFAGRPVLLVGAVVGPGTISVVAWRPLDDPAGTDGAP